MDINIFRIVATVGGLIGFVGILVWAYLPGRKEQFDEAARLPFFADQERPNE